MARHHLALPLLPLLLLAGCPRAERGDGPAPVAMTPSSGTGVVALPVVIVGDHFDASVQTDFGKGSATLSATFVARLVPEGGGVAVPLDAVRLTAERRLEATVPAGIARGGYALEVIDPAGRAGTLPQAFRVFSAPENVAGFRVEPAEAAHAGVPFAVGLTAVDAAGAVVDGFDGQVTLSDTTGTVTPTTAGPFDRGLLLARITVTAVSAADQLTATDGLGHAGSSAPFAVEPGPPVAIAFASAPVSVRAGTCSGLVTLELRDVLGNPSPASAAVEVTLQVAPPGGLQSHVGGGACATPVSAVTISAGSTTTAFRYTGVAAGAFTLRAAPVGLPSATLDVDLTP